MKNVRPNQLKKCIFVDAEEFTTIVQAVFDNENIKVDYTLEGIDIYTDDDCVNTGDLYEKIGAYFDVKITSIHIDDCDYIGVWIVYKEKGETNMAYAESFTEETIDYNDLLMEQQEQM